MKILTSGLSVVAISLLIAGCNNTETTTYYAADGKTIIKVEEKTTESAARHKDFAMGGAVTAVKVETTGSTSSGTPLPNFIIGGGASGIASSPSESKRPVINITRSAGVLSSLTNGSAYSGTTNYIGVPNETAAETKARLTALLAFQAGTLSESAQPDSNSSNETK